MEYSKITLDRGALPRVIEKTLAIANKGKSESEKIDGMQIKSLLRIVDGQIKFVPTATLQAEKIKQNEIHLAVIGAEREILKEELIEIARQTDILVNTNQEMVKTFTDYSKVFTYS